MAKHWKSFVKKEESSEKEEALNLASLLSADAKQTDKSLEDVAEFNSNLKSLLDEQKELEGEMANLTGQKKESNTDKRYKSQIKTIDQKRKEQHAEEQQQRLKKQRRQDQKDWSVETPSTQKVKKETGVDAPKISKEKKPVQKKETGFLHKKKASKVAAKLPEIQKKIAKEIEFPTQKNQVKEVSSFEKKIKKKNIIVDDFAAKQKKQEAAIKQRIKEIKEKSTAKKQPTSFIEYSEKPKETTDFTAKKKKVKPLVDRLQTSKKKIETVANHIQKTKKKTTSLLDVSKKKKPSKKSPQLPISKIAAKKEMLLDVGKKTKKAVNVLQTAQKVGTKLDAGIKQITTVVKSPELQKISKGVSKGVALVSKVGNQLNKVEKVFNTANKYLEKTTAVSNLFEKKLDAVNFIETKNKKTNDAFNLDFLQQKQSKKEETANFNVGEKKATVDFTAIKKIKKGIDTFQNSTKKKDSFSF